MTKGKHGTAVAVKRLADSEARVAELESQIRTERAEAAFRERELRAEIQNLNGDFSKRVREASSETILAAQEKALRVAADAERRAEQRVRDLLRFIFTHAPEVSFADTETGGVGKWSELADVAGIQYGEMLALNPNLKTNNKMRRGTTRQANLAADIRRDPDSIGL